MKQSNGDSAAVCFDQTEDAKYEHTELYGSIDKAANETPEYMNHFEI